MFSPTGTWVLETVFSWKGLSLYALIDIQQGGDIYSVNTKYGQATGVYAETAGNNPKGNPKRDRLPMVVVIFLQTPFLQMELPTMSMWMPTDGADTGTTTIHQLLDMFLMLPM